MQCEWIATGLWLCRGGGTALVDNPHAGEDENHGDDLVPVHRVETDGNADDGGDDWLHVVVHAHEGGTQTFLPDGDQEVGDEGREEHHVGNLPKYRGIDL